MVAVSLPRGGALCFLHPSVLFDKAPPLPPFPIRLFSLTYPSRIFSFCRASKKNSSLQPALKQKSFEEEEEDFDDEILEDDFEDFEDDVELEAEPYVGDGGGGGGISLCGTVWEAEALSIAEEISMSFNGDLKIFAFKASPNQLIQVRIEKLSTKYGSPSIDDIEAFSSAYRTRLDEAVNAGSIPENFSLEVSSPGVERVIRIPDDLERYKDRSMLVKYIIDDAIESSSVSEGVFRLVSFDVESGHCTWGIADVRINRERAGKGRPLSKKQREWRLQTPFKCLRLVRLYSEC